MRALATLTLPAFDADLIAVVPPTLARLTLLCVLGPVPRRAPADRPPRSPKFRRLASGCLGGARNGCASSRQAQREPGSRSGSPPGCPVRRVTLRAASTLYDGLHPVALFDGWGTS
jgi:hypothetical protein